MSSLRGRLAVGVSAALLLFPAAASADTLADALAQAYRTNPTLAARRADLRGVAETVVQARTGWRPVVTVTAGAQYDRTDLGRGADRLVDTGNGVVTSAGATRVESNLGQAQIAVAQPLYTGGRTTWAVREAQARTGAAGEDLRGVEAQVLQSVVQAYADVLRDEESLKIHQADLETLGRQASESAAKFEHGQVTRTDVAQAEAQREAARAAVAAAQAQLAVSRASYEAAVGSPPGSLEAPGALPGLPADIDQAFDLAEAANPSLASSRLVETASRARVAEMRAQFRPTVALQGAFGYAGAVSPLATEAYDRSLSGGVVVTQPLFTGGLRSSQVRQAQAENSRDRSAIEVARRDAVRATASAWNLLLGARAETAAAVAQVNAAETALRGAQAEYGYGLRTTLDVLIADQNLRSAQLSAASSRHDDLVAQAQVLAVVGRMDARTLLPGEPTVLSGGPPRNAGAPPWEGVISALDSLGAPSASDR